MSNANVKVLAILAVAAVCVASVGYLVWSQHGDEPEKKFTGHDRLMVYGNANNDDYIDNDDIVYLEKIISGELEETKFADANRDNSINQADIDFVRSIINKTSGYVYVAQTYNKTEEVVKCKYPLNATCVAGYEAITIMKNIGAASKIVCLSGASGDSFNEKFYSDVYDLPKVGPSIWKIDLELISKQPVDSVVAMDAASYVDNYAMLRAAGIDVVRVEAAHSTNSMKGIVTLGFLFECVEGATKLMKFYDGIKSDITKKLEHISYENRKTALFVTMSNYVEGPKEMSEYTGTLETAGARSIADTAGWGEGKARRQFHIGDEWLLSYQSQFIVHSRAMGLGEVNTVKTYADLGQYFTGMDAYKNGKYYILNSSLSPMLRIAFMAEFFYPEIFGENYAVGLVQEYYDTFLLNVKDFDASKDGVWFISKSTLPTT